ncbi:cytochrome b/b6 domain-containing protein [Profundibacter amoris]|uniref:Cytochrome B n=1 Tax=Profundibacter amoris TaxID=2171755 RepID=A0A347UDJ9_9RHOB|nr:cytochrome b/b6 domain-containing protein [Profundibacter amoris]AXX96927.1 cytochrome B [Profundibacter amoris]
MIKVWDPLQRLFHWGLVASIAIAWLTSEDGEALHEWAGYAALGLIAFRLVWGFIGPRYARFSQFIRGPKAVIDYTRDMLNKREKRYIGHNPLGAVMVVALLATTGATGFTGWLMVEPERMAMLPEMPAFVTPAFADSDGDEEREYGGYGEGDEEAMEEIHEFFANLLLLLIFLHVAGVIYASRRHKENLARAMITGKKLAAAPDDIA